MSFGDGLTAVGTESRTAAGDLPGWDIAGQGGQGPRKATGCQNSPFPIWFGLTKAEVITFGCDL